MSPTGRIHALASGREIDVMRIIDFRFQECLEHGIGIANMAQGLPENLWLEAQLNYVVIARTFLERNNFPGHKLLAYKYAETS